jgi:hypothetical protein
MEFSEKYKPAKDVITTTDEKTGLTTITEKISISNDAYAIGEMIDLLIKKIEHARQSL